MKKTSPKISDETLEATPPAETPTPQENQYFEIRIPKISLRSKTLNTYLTCVLLIFAFLLGMLTNKALYLHTQVKAATKTPPTAAQPTTDPVPTTPQKVTTGEGKLPLLGDKNAKVTIIEFSDFQCPFCKQYFDNTAQQIYDTYIKTGKAKFAYRYFPLVTIHPNAQKSSEAAECANDQNKFWDYHDLLFKNQEIWSAQAAADAENSFLDYATQLGLDTNKFKNCLDTDQFKQNVDNDVTDGDKIGVTGTPSFVINGNFIVGAVPFATLQQTIEQELNK
jgi:protein-disulfide isomerase